MFSGFLVHCRGARPGVREMSMMISIRRGKGRSLDAYSTAHWLKSINNKTTQWGAHLVVHSIPIANQLHFPVYGRNIYPAFKDLLHVCLCISSSLSVCKSPNHWPQGDAESIQKQIPLSIPIILPHLSIPHSFFTISPISDCSVVAVSLCVGEACMCILTRAALRFPPYANTERLLPVLQNLINKGISIELLLKLMETDGCCCLQV